MKRYIKSITFDAKILGKEYKNILLDFSDDNIDETYIYDEDGPWCMAEIEDGIIYDFQVYTEPDEGLKIQACRMEWEGKYYSHKDFLYDNDFLYKNIEINFAD